MNEPNFSPLPLFPPLDHTQQDNAYTKATVPLAPLFWGGPVGLRQKEGEHERWNTPWIQTGRLFVAPQPARFRGEV